MNETWLIGTGRLTTPCQGDDSGISSPYESPPTIFPLRPLSEIFWQRETNILRSVSCMAQKKKKRKA